MSASEIHRDASVPTRSTLLERLKNWGDQEGWRRFFDLYWKLLYCIAVKAGLSDMEARDVVQETVIAVARNMREGRFTRRRGAFKAWLLTILHRTIASHYRRRKRELRIKHAETGSGTPLIERLPAPSSDQVKELWAEEWARNLADAALERVRRAANPRHFQIFDLYVLKDRPVLEVAKVLRVNVAQVYLAKFRITKMIRKEVRKLEAEAAWMDGDVDLLRDSRAQEDEADDHRGDNRQE